MKEHNESHLNNLDSQLVCIYAIDELSRNIAVSDSQTTAIKKRNLSETDNLGSQLNLKIDSPVMLASYIDIVDRLKNGLLGRVTKFSYSNNSVSVVYVKFNDDSAELVAR